MYSKLVFHRYQLWQDTHHYTSTYLCINGRVSLAVSLNTGQGLDNSAHREMNIYRKWRFFLTYFCLIHIILLMFVDFVNKNVPLKIEKWPRHYFKHSLTGASISFCDVMDILKRGKFERQKWKEQFVATECLQFTNVWTRSIWRFLKMRTKLFFIPDPFDHWSEICMSMTDRL